MTAASTFVARGPHGRSRGVRYCPFLRCLHGVNPYLQYLLQLGRCFVRALQNQVWQLRRSRQHRFGGFLPIQEGDVLWAFIREGEILMCCCSSRPLRGCCSFALVPAFFISSFEDLAVAARLEAVPAKEVTCACRSRSASTCARRSRSAFQAFDREGWVRGAASKAPAAVARYAIAALRAIPILGRSLSEFP